MLDVLVPIGFVVVVDVAHLDDGALAAQLAADHMLLGRNAAVMVEVDGQRFLVLELLGDDHEVGRPTQGVEGFSFVADAAVLVNFVSLSFLHTLSVLVVELLLVDPIA